MEIALAQNFIALYESTRLQFADSSIKFVND